MAKSLIVYDPLRGFAKDFITIGRFPIEIKTKIKIITKLVVILILSHQLMITTYNKISYFGFKFLATDETISTIKLEYQYILF